MIKCEINNGVVKWNVNRVKCEGMFDHVNIDFTFIPPSQRIFAVDFRY